MGDKYAQLWYADIANFPNVNQFELLAKRPYYRTLLFHRLGAWGGVNRLYPSYCHFSIH